MPSNTKENGFETLIVDTLVNSNGYEQGITTEYNKQYAIDEDRLFRFLMSTQKKAMDELHILDSDLEKDRFFKQLDKKLKSDGVIELLRKGLRYKHLRLDLFYVRPSVHNPEAAALYEKNIFSVTRQLQYSSFNPRLALDVCAFINGLPVITMELKNQLTKQNVFDAVEQYKNDRTPDEVLFSFKRCIVHFAVDDNEIRMCTELKGKKSWFLPFNKGFNNGAGNPPNPNGIKTDYLWKEILTKDELSNIIENYAQVIAEKDEDTGVTKYKQVFPRYHQLSVVKSLLSDAKRDGVGGRYLIQHSAGSGKSNSIAWLAHQLVTLKNDSGKEIFDTVIVVTDRINLDKQIKDTIKQFMQVSATVGWAKSAGELKQLLNEGKKIIITIVHKFQFILDDIGEVHKDKNFAILIDEAHSSQNGSLSAKMNMVLSGSVYGKNQKREDVKSHHYIISFDPKDVPDHGLTVDLAQSLGEKFCKEHFPGHQAIVCTHPDGHNGSGNVHVHIVINSLRIEEVPFMPYMDRSCDTRPGMKHRCTNAAMEYFRSEVMEMCHDAGLYQIDLLNGSKTRVTEREYWAKKKGQLALDEENAVLAEQGLPVKQTKFETDKDKLREEIRMALSDAVSFEDFAEKLLRRGITVKESRGRLSYLTPDRTKPITARKLGDDFDKAAVFAIFVRNTKRVRAKTDTIHSAPAMQKIINERDTVSRMVDIDAAKEKGKGYEHWAKKHNLKNASRAYLLYKEMGFDSPEALATACDAAHEKLSDIRTEMKSVEATIAEKKELRNHVLNYHKTRYVIDEMKACKNEKARQKYRDEHDSDFIILNTAKCYFDSKGLKKLPSHKALQTEVEQLIKEKNELYNQYQTAKEEAQRLGTIRHNLEQTLGRKIEHKKEQER